jgi:serine protease AprX
MATTPVEVRRRFFVRMKHPTQMEALAPAMLVDVDAYRSRTDANILIAALAPHELDRLAQQQVEIIPSTQYQPLQAPDSVHVALDFHPLNMDDVMSHIKADKAWEQSRGENVHIAIVDTGICGTLPEFAGGKQSQFRWSLSPQDDPWTDAKGHGSMTAAIAAATNASGGRYSGVAPDSPIIACKTSFDDTELYQIYEYLIQLVESGKVKRLVVNNSYGRYVCAAPTINEDDPFPTILRRAVSKGIVVVFAAGNNHVVICKNDPTQCGPNTIWSVNSFDEVISVGTVDRNNRMDQPPRTLGGYSHRDSSRGPGQFASAISPKPDCVAPTYGEVVWGCGYVPMEWWGTSGAAPQVAGLAALILSKNPSLTAAQVQGIIKKTCVPIGLAPTCAGAGLIDCMAALSKASGKV